MCVCSFSLGTQVCVAIQVFLQVITQVRVSLTLSISSYPPMCLSPFSIGLFLGMRRYSSIDLGKNLGTCLSQQVNTYLCVSVHFLQVNTQVWILIHLSLVHYLGMCLSQQVNTYLCISVHFLQVNTQVWIFIHLSLVQYIALFLSQSFYRSIHMCLCSFFSRSIHRFLSLSSSSRSKSMCFSPSFFSSICLCLS